MTTARQAILDIVIETEEEIELIRTLGYTFEERDQQTLHLLFEFLSKIRSEVD